MRLATLILFLLSLGALAIAAYGSSGVWRLGLAANAVLTALFILALIGSLLETALPDKTRAAWGAEALGAEIVAMGLSRIAPLGSLPPRPLEDLLHAGMSLGGLGCCVGGLALAILAVRSRDTLAGVLSGLAMLGALLALGPWVMRL